MTFGEKFVAMRMARGWTQQDFADRICKSRAAVSLWEAGIRTPGFKTLARIAEIFQVSVDLLVDQNNQPLETDWAPLMQAMRSAHRPPSRQELAILVSLVRQFMKED